MPTLAMDATEVMIEMVWTSSRHSSHAVGHTRGLLVVRLSLSDMGIDGLGWRAKIHLTPASEG